MELGRFSVSLSVADLATSRRFYEALGFAQVAGEADQGWIILQNGEAKIGLFHGMFEGNLMTFNPTDARAIEAAMKEKGYEPVAPAEAGEGPCHFMLKDPDGNLVLVDQH